MCTSESDLKFMQARAAPALMLAESESPGCLANGQALAVREAGQSHSKAAHEDEVSWVHALVM